MKVGDSCLLGSAEEQREFGARLAGSLPRGTVLFLDGDLGSGKTTLAQGLIGDLGFEGEVSSPTYALMQVYPTEAGPALHVDAYRVRAPFELWSMDLERLVEDSVLSVIEWGQLFYEDFPQGWRLELDYAEEGGRRVTRVR